jgi:hypothetical protein
MFRWEEEPTFKDAHDGSHRVVSKLGGESSAFYGIGQCLVVLTLHSQAATLPEIGDREEFLVVGLFVEAQNKIEMSDRQLGSLLRHRNHSLSQAEVHVVVQWQAGRADREKRDTTSLTSLGR